MAGRLKCMCGMAFCMFLLAACEDNSKQKAKTSPRLSYQVLTLAPRTTTIYSDFPATIQGEDVVEIRPMVDGYLEQIYVPEGGTVKKGQLLFRIKNPQYEQAVITAQAAIKSATADVEAAKMDVEKVRPLVEREIVSRYQLSSAQYTLQSKEAALAEAEATLKNAQTNLGYTILRSPQDGVVGAIPYKIGALISNSNTNPLTTLSHITNVYAYFSLNEKQLLSFSNRVEGATLQDKLDHLPMVSLILADGSLYALKGHLQTASGLIATEAGTASLKASFPNPRGIIRSGASAVVRIPRTEYSALIVPQNASYELQNKQFVYTLTKDNKCVSTAITSVPTNDGQFLIVQSGLKPGDRVILGAFNMKDSTVVIPVPANADSLYSNLGTTN